jgi:hypothetical protein
MALLGKHSSIGKGALFQVSSGGGVMLGAAGERLQELNKPVFRDADVAVAAPDHGYRAFSHPIHDPRPRRFGPLLGLLDSE